MKKLFPVIFLFLIALSGCLTVISADSTLELMANEHWKFRTELKVPEFEVLTYGSTISEQFNNEVVKAESVGVKLDWKLVEGSSDGFVLYIIEAKGNNYESWNNWIGTVDSLQVVGDSDEPLVNFSLSLLTSGLNLGLSNTFILKGGKVLDSNGTVLNTNSVKWINPVTMYASMEYPNLNFPPWVFMVGGAVLLLIVLIIIILSVQKNKSQYPHNYHPSNYPRNYPNNRGGIPSNRRNINQNRRSVRYCSGCGKPLSDGARHCIYCGKPKAF